MLLVLLTALVAIPATGAGAHGISAGKSKKAEPNRAPASGALGLQGVSERRLRKLETKLLGPSHAAEHAKARRSLNRKGGRAKLRRQQAKIAKRLRAARRKRRLVRTAAAGDDGFWSPPSRSP